MQYYTRWQIFVLCISLFGLASAFQMPQHHPVSVTTNSANTRTSAGTGTTLFMAKAKKAAVASKKFQVKMLKSVPGTGQKGEIVNVTPAFFNNKLRPTQSAEVISDDEVEEERARQAAQEAEIRAEATALQEELQAETLTMHRKAGPDGQLFGGIGAKAIMEEIQSHFSAHKEFLERKNVKVLALTDENDKKMRGDIKHTGDFSAQISLSKDVKATVKITVVTED